MTQALETIQNRMLEAEKEAGRSLGEVCLVAVSKTVPPLRIAPVLEAGHRVFGENRVQEAAQKWPDLRKKYPNTHLHLIGPLQSNKVEAAVGLFDTIETLDREKIVRLVAEQMRLQGKVCELFVQVNIGEEPQKSGVSPGALAPFLELCRDHGVSIAGLMAIPPQGVFPRPFFEGLRDLAQAFDLKKLSMGMSQDFEEAIACGATHVRVGSALFGAR